MPVTILSKSVDTKITEKILTDGFCLCTWSAHTNTNTHRDEKTGQFPHWFTLKYPHRMCITHGKLI